MTVHEKLTLARKSVNIDLWAVKAKEGEKSLY